MGRMTTSDARRDARPDAGPDAPPDARPGTRRDALRGRRSLDTLRRYSFTTIVGLLVMLAWVGSVPAIVADDTPTWSRVLGVAALVVLSVAIWQLTAVHVPVHSPAAPGGIRAWTVAGWVAAVVIAVPWVARIDSIFWSIGLFAMLSLHAVSWSRRTQVLAGTAGVVAIAAVGAVVAAVVEGPGADRVGWQLSGNLFVGAVVVSTVIVSVWTWQVAAELDAARGSAARLAVADERLRFASELHDIQGHHLQVIALKSELALRLLAADPDRARGEVAEIRSLATTALTQTRELVHGYARTGVEAELTNASAVLTSASIDARVEVVGAPPGEALDELLDEEQRHLLGLTVREATTNVLRHSRASWASFTLRSDADRVEVTVANDGAGATDGGVTDGGTVDSTGASGAADGAGTGLRSLAERLRATGGDLRYERTGEEFRVHVALPTTEAVR